MTTFLLIRHGETDAVGRVLAGRTPGWHLNWNGREQVRKLAQRLSRLPIQAVYTSPLERARETAQIIAAVHGLTPRVAEDLGEIHFGAWEGRVIADLELLEPWREYNMRRSCTPPPGGEPIGQVQSRMLRRLDCLRALHDNQTVAVVSHGDPLRAALCHYLGVPLDGMLRFEIAAGSVSVVQAGDGDARVLCLNATGDLPI
jgi:probable phosphoglycerate mutase